MKKIFTLSKVNKIEEIKENWKIIGLFSIFSLIVGLTTVSILGTLNQKSETFVVSVSSASYRVLSINHEMPEVTTFNNPELSPTILIGKENFATTTTIAEIDFPEAVKQRPTVLDPVVAPTPTTQPITPITTTTINVQAEIAP